MARKNYSITIPPELEYDFDQLREKIKLATNLARVYNRNESKKKFPDSVSDIFIEAMNGECDKIINKLSSKVTESDMEKYEARKEYITKYYQNYRINKAKT
jgi:hypothetical protein